MVKRSITFCELEAASGSHRIGEIFDEFLRSEQPMAVAIRECYEKNNLLIIDFKKEGDAYER